MLVTADGTPKLLDFGIAKLLNPELAGHTLAPTAAGPQLMTPEYASPEQVRGEPVTTATDVYSLGVLLYELLTGRLPYRITGRTPADIARVVCEATPVRPSTAVTTLAEQEPTGGSDSSEGTAAPPRGGSRHASHHRHERLRRRLAGDLDNIVLKALSKEPTRRYASVEQFAEDVRRHLDGLPVIARKDTIGYRTAKFVRRNRALVAAGAVTLVALLAGHRQHGMAGQRRAARAGARRGAGSTTCASWPTRRCSSCTTPFASCRGRRRRASCSSPRAWSTWTSCRKTRAIEPTCSASWPAGM